MSVTFGTPVASPPAATQVASEQIGGAEYQLLKVVDGTVAGTNRLTVTAAGAAKVDGSAVTQPVSAASLPLPTGASTEATLAAVNAATGAQADAEATGNGSIIAILKRLRTLLAGGLPAALVGGRLDVAIGQMPAVSVIGLATVDLDTGAGTDMRSPVGLALAAPGGHLLVGAANPMPVSDNGASLTVDGSVSLAAAIPTGTNNIGDVDVASGPTGASSLQHQGAAAHDAAVAGNPVLVGFRANANEPAAVSTDADAVYGWADLLGRQVVLPGHPNPEAPVTVNATALGATTVIAAPGVSVSIYACKASVHNRAATNRLVDLRDGAAGTVCWRAEIAAEGGGALIDFGERGWKLTANTLLAVNLDAAGDVDVNITSYYISA